MIEVDLHLHSRHSDGVHPPSVVVAMGAAAGLSAIALTDHDTVDGIEEARRAAPKGFEVIAGVELSSVYRGREIHLLAYFIDHADSGLRRFLDPLRRERRARAERIVEQLNGAGVPITLDEVLEIAGGVAADGSAFASIGRPHIAEAIVRRGAARDIDDAFVRYLRRGQPGHVPRACVTVEQSVAMTRGQGGAIVVAHPALNLGDSDTEALAREGIDGIEVWHPKHAEEQRVRLLEIANRCGLVATGGSDYHGPGRSRHAIASAGVPLSTVAALRERGQRLGL